MVVCYEDDLLIFAQQETLVHNIVAKLKRKFVTKDLDILQQFLKMNFHWDCDLNTNSLNQQCLVNKLLLFACLNDAKPIRSPIRQDFWLEEEDKLADAVISRQYRSIARSLLYITVNSRPDLRVAASMLETNVLSLEHWLCAKIVLRYLRGTATKKLR